jgi:hypothetical protein
VAEIVLHWPHYVIGDWIRFGELLLLPEHLPMLKVELEERF